MVELLDRLGWSQRYFADHVGVSVETVNDWCRGKTGGPGMRVSVKYLTLVCRVLGV